MIWYGVNRRYGIWINIYRSVLVAYCSQTATVEVDDEKAVKRSSVVGSQSPTTVVVTCRMLDCDTISQAKAKALNALYANTPFSCRPSLDDVELCEWTEYYSRNLYSPITRQMKHSRQICTQDKENMKKKNIHTHPTIQHWPRAYLLHLCCNSFVMFVCLSLYSLLPDLWWIKLFNNYYAEKFLFNMICNWVVQSRLSHLRKFFCVINN